MNGIRVPALANSVVVLVVFAAFLALGGSVVRAEDEDDVKVPDGLALSEFRGYESWQLVSISQTKELLNAIVANPEMIRAYESGIPGNGKPFPDGAKAAKIQWTPKKSTEAPFAVNIPAGLKDVAFMAKDSKRFADGGGWGFALFNYDATEDRFTPDGAGFKCGFTCHSKVKADDYVFTAFEKR